VRFLLTHFRFALAAVIAFAFITGAIVWLSPSNSELSPQEANWLRYFPRDYLESRNHFREDCERHLASSSDFCRRFYVASPTDPDLTIDYGFFTEGGDRLLVLQSGIHGSEAATGAAVQELVFRKFLSRLLKRHIDVLFIHALDPYGFKYVRRTDEFNVNLNRNFVIGANYHNLRNPDYERLRSLFEPKGPVSSAWGSSLSVYWNFLVQLFSDRFDSTSLSNGLDSGQYSHPDGINFGGAQPSQQVAFLRATLSPIFATPYKKIIFLDFHTGLGRDGELAVIKGIEPPPQLMREFAGLIGGHESDGIVIHSGGDAGFFPTSGDVIDFVPTLATSPSGRVLALTMEYGSMGSDVASQLDSAARIILENETHYYPCDASHEAPCVKIRSNFQEMFYPSTDVWRVKVMREAELVFSLLLTWETPTTSSARPQH